MKVPFDWLKELVELKVSKDELVRLIPLRTIGLKEVTGNFFELDMKGYNRADLLSMRGVANEIAAITDARVRFKELPETDYVWIRKSFPNTPVSIQNEAPRPASRDVVSSPSFGGAESTEAESKSAKADKNLCQIQAVARIEGLKPRKSPTQWVKKLNDSGIRSVDNITDVTNLIMLEYGQPLHAFDAQTVEDHTINVRQAKPGEEITTLDGKSRRLVASDIVLADTQKALDVAGVMGGKDTEVKDSTTTILLSASLFNPGMIRSTAIRLGLYSEASKRFQHGLTGKRLFQALDAAIKMYQELGGKLTALTIFGEKEDQAKKIPLNLKKVNELIGIEISSEQVKEYLKMLNFKLEEEKNADGEIAWVITPPYYRLDINIEEDLIEEVARIYGYENIPSKALRGDQPEKIDQSLFDLIYNLKSTLTDLGLTEVQSYSFFSTKVLNALDWNTRSQKFLIKIANPISSETEYLRQNIWSGLVEIAGKNLKHGFTDIAIFEIGKVYILKDNTPIEKYTISAALINGSNNPIEELIAVFNKLNSKLELKLDFKKTSIKGTVEQLFHPVRFATINFQDEQIGVITEVHPKVSFSLGFDKRIAVFEFWVEKLF